jgi:hypothetical protein
MAESVKENFYSPKEYKKFGFKWLNVCEYAGYLLIKIKYAHIN